MISLLINASGTDDAASSETRFGGRPSAPEVDFMWPTCRTCEGNMQFQGQLRIPDQDAECVLLLLFMCQNDPGLCDEWDADAGGNAVVPVCCDHLDLIEPPPDGDTIRPTVHGAALVNVEGDDYDEVRAAWSEAAGVSVLEVLGQLGGAPSWIQGEEVPSCDACERPMLFVAQLEQGPDWQTEMNFGGGGRAYVYRCGCEQHQAKMLWQC